MDQSMGSINGVLNLSPVRSLTKNAPAHTGARDHTADICHRRSFETIDFGPVRYAHITEGLYLLRVNAPQDDFDFEWNHPTNQRVT